MLMMAGYEKNYARTVAATNALNDTAVEYIGGIEVIKVFGKAKSSYEKFVSAARECAQSYIDWMNKSNFYFTFAMNIMPATLLTVLPIGGMLLKNGTLTPEKFVLIVILSMGLISPIIGCMKYTDDLAKVGTIIGQVTDILTAPELSRPETDVQTPQGSTVELHGVHFGYGDTEVLHGIDLIFREGTVNALVGPSGSGKSTIAKLIDVGVVVLSLVLYTGGRMELLNCVMLCICSFLLTEGLEQAGAQSSLLRVVDTCVDQASGILNPPAMDISGAELTPEHRGLHAEDIRFSYGEKPIINGITLDIPERTTTAIVGPSGSGKTTLCHLLSRFWDVDGGRVTLGGRDVREYDMDSLMQNFSFVFQNVYLFHDTVANNIRFGRPDAPMEKVIEAAKKARCHNFIMKLPQGYETVIGEAGGFPLPAP